MCTLSQLVAIITKYMLAWGSSLARFVGVETGKGDDVGAGAINSTSAGACATRRIAELVDKAMGVNGVQSKSAPWAGMARS